MKQTSPSRGRIKLAEYRDSIFRWKPDLCLKDKQVKRIDRNHWLPKEQNIRMNKANLINKDIEAILQTEYQDISQLVEDYQDVPVSEENQEALYAYNLLYMNIHSLSEQEYLDAFNQLGEKYPNYGLAAENDHKRTIAELERLKQAFSQLCLQTEQGQYLLQLKLKSIDLDIQVYQKLMQLPITPAIQAEIDLLESDSYKLIDEIEAILIQYVDE